MRLHPARAAMEGASPRGRRSRPPRQPRRAARGRISAWAEEPVGATRVRVRGRAHLRVVGGAGHVASSRPTAAGASPRGRRSLRLALPLARARGRISAWAEEPTTGPDGTTTAEAHLRLGGGAAVGSSIRVASWGASPRGRRSRTACPGRPRTLGRISAWAEEPRTRASRRGVEGRISAWAEEPTRPPANMMPRAHLRVGGGAATRPSRIEHWEGASPRGRRSPGCGGHAGPRRGRISAWAEEPRAGEGGRRCNGAHLRVGGGARDSQGAALAGIGASPRGRRSPAGEPDRDRESGRISAWAEEPYALYVRYSGAAAHLRVGGGAGVARRGAPLGDGASPRGRRSQHSHDGHVVAQRRISAWAEQLQRGNCEVRPATGASPRGRRSPCQGAPACRARYGASPRGRRSPGRAARPRRPPRRISAWAEEPEAAAGRVLVWTAHLRVGGGATTTPGLSTGSAGAFLRVGGGACTTGGYCDRAPGASPRGRRSLRGYRRRHRSRGRISAWAEEPAAPRRPLGPGGAHLRVGGGARAGGPHRAYDIGASPRGREEPGLLSNLDPLQGASPRGRRSPHAPTGDRLICGASPRGRRSPATDSQCRCASGRISAWAEEPTCRASPTRSRWAHLRVGGGADATTVPFGSVSGASPRGRRSPWPACAPFGVPRRISAWAEEPCTIASSKRPKRAHLRVGGGARIAILCGRKTTGASPRGRRSHGDIRHGPRRDGRISAWAEEPPRRRRSPSSPGAHLRVGGGATWRSCCRMPCAGASPRGRRSLHKRKCPPPLNRRISAWAEEPDAPTGGRRAQRAHLRVGGGAPDGTSTAWPVTGASPRGRRSHAYNVMAGHVEGRISAWAEEPHRDDGRIAGYGAHLRVGGGAHPRLGPRREHAGASPRGRRSRVLEPRGRDRLRRISAWAEEPRTSGGTSIPRTAHLRVGGGAGMVSGRVPADTGASPRGRRSLPRHLRHHRIERRISAWAEEPTARARPCTCSMAHLRVGGGAFASTSFSKPPSGASPRGRRSPRALLQALAQHRRISAWAEEPSPVGASCPLDWAHLRVGGGAVAGRTHTAAHLGASPRGRRSRVLDRRIPYPSRRISAWAEEPPPSAREWCSPWAHLRVGGGAGVGQETNRQYEGRVSAWAEEPMTARAVVSSWEAHLRVGGGAVMVLAIA